MTYPVTGSTISSRTTSGLSTLITVKVGGVRVGALQTLTINQAREIIKWQEIGTDGFVENHPKSAANITAEITRVVFDELRISEAFARGFINIQAQRIPFDIDIIDRTSGNGSSAIVTTLHSCWFNKMSTPYQSGNYLITESAGIDCKKITSSRMGESAVSGGFRGIAYESDAIERNTDVKSIPGRFDSAGSTYPNLFGTATGEAVVAGITTTTKSFSTGQR